VLLYKDFNDVLGKFLLMVVIKNVLHNMLSKTVRNECYYSLTVNEIP